MTEKSVLHIFKKNIDKILLPKLLHHITKYGHIRAYCIMLHYCTSLQNMVIFRWYSGLLRHPKLLHHPTKYCHIWSSLGVKTCSTRATLLISHRNTTATWRIFPSWPEMLKLYLADISVMAPAEHPCKYAWPLNVLKKMFELQHTTALGAKMTPI